MHKEYNGVLNRRQELPDEAFIGVEELKRIEAGAKRGFNDSEARMRNLTFDAFEGPGGFFTRVTRYLCSVATPCMLTSGRNPDGLLPVVAISYVRRASHPHPCLRHRPG